MERIAFLFDAIGYDKFGRPYDASFGFSCPTVTPKHLVSSMIRQLQIEFQQQHNGEIVNQATIRLR